MTGRKKTSPCPRLAMLYIFQLSLIRSALYCSFNFASRLSPKRIKQYSKLSFTTLSLATDLRLFRSTSDGIEILALPCPEKMAVVGRPFTYLNK